MITHCPSCQLSFRISESQLNAAAGLVRCGACLQVFNANDHMDTEVRQNTLPISTGNPPKSATLLDHDHSHIDDNLDFKLPEQQTGIDHKAPCGSDTSPSLEIKPVEIQLQGTTPCSGQTGEASAATSPVLSATIPETLSATIAPVIKPVESATPANPSIYPPVAQPQELQSTSAAVSTPSEPALTSRPTDLGSAAVASDHGAMVEAFEANLTIADIPRNLTTPLFDADNFTNQDHDRDASRPQRLWYLALLIGALALPVQYAHFHADILGQDPRWRPALEILCRATRCVLAPMANTALIAATDLVVRSHPDNPGALRVDATLLNQALFAQPFPHLTLRFENLQGEIVAIRTFPPDKYLGGELKDLVLIPSQQPVKLELDILDPGPEAVSYSLTVTDSARQ